MAHACVPVVLFNAFQTTAGIIDASRARLPLAERVTSNDNISRTRKQNSSTDQNPVPELLDLVLDLVSGLLECGLNFLF
jgi:hypothetical protein